MIAGFRDAGYKIEKDYGSSRSQQELLRALDDKEPIDPVTQALRPGLTHVAPPALGSRRTQPILRLLDLFLFVGWEAVLTDALKPHAVGGERLAAAFTMPAFSGSLHSALEILVMNGGLVALRSR